MTKRKGAKTARTLRRSELTRVLRDQFGKTVGGLVREFAEEKEMLRSITRIRGERIGELANQVQVLRNEVNHPWRLLLRHYSRKIAGSSQTWGAK